MKTYAFNDLGYARLAEVATIAHERRQPAVWDALAARPLDERELLGLGPVVDRLADSRKQRDTRAALGPRAIHPLLSLAERGAIRAFSQVALAARFGDVELIGEVDMALARSVGGEVGHPCFLVIEARRGLSGADPLGQLLGAMLCAARGEGQEGGRAGGGEVFGCYTLADVWTFVRGTLDWGGAKPAMSVLSSREYAEKTEAAAILAMLGSIVAAAA